MIYYWVQTQKNNTLPDKKSTRR